jgi:ferredoxin-NADP reductase
MTSSEQEQKLVVHARAQLAKDVVEIGLTLPDQKQLPHWRPGAHVDLELPNGLVRQYSLCGSPEDAATYRIAVLREPQGRGGSMAAHQLTLGEEVTVRGPRNNFELLPSHRYLFIAGGIGITPLVPMLETATAQQADWRLVYGGRSRGSMAYRDELVKKYGSRVEIVPQDEFGLLDLESIVGTPEPGILVYCCGPEPLLQAVEAKMRSWPRGALHVERFTPKQAQANSPTHEFEVVLAQSGQTLTVPADKSVLQTIRDSGVSVLASCLEGTCGTCELSVLEGEVDHRDSLLDDEEQAAMDCMMVCVSRAKSNRLILDI